MEIINRVAILCLNGKSTNLLPNLINYFYSNSSIKDSISPNKFLINKNFLTNDYIKFCSLKPKSDSYEIGDSCDKTHYCVFEPNLLSKGVCCPSKSYFFLLKIIIKKLEYKLIIFFRIYLLTNS